MKDSQVSVLTYLTLFSSGSTLICCALPAVFVTLGAGAAFASITQDFPLLFVIASNKVWLFWGTGILLLLSGILLYKNRFAACPADPVLAKACTRLRAINRVVYAFSIIAFCIGLFFAYGYGLIYG